MQLRFTGLHVPGRTLFRCSCALQPKRIALLPRPTRSRTRAVYLAESDGAAVAAELGSGAWRPIRIMCSAQRPGERHSWVRLGGPD
ncbi:hypothetical protein AES38_15140 (plasmid) [Clavibacter capsici]|nr:hypothetical protein AES38_15140 [Clavibacter capsici]